MNWRLRLIIRSPEDVVHQMQEKKCGLRKMSTSYVMSIELAWGEEDACDETQSPWRSRGGIAITSLELEMCVARGMETSY